MIVLSQKTLLRWLTCLLRSKIILTVFLCRRYFFLLAVVFLKLDSGEFWGNASNLLNKGKSVIPPLFYGQDMLSSASDKANLFAENFSKNSDIDDSGIALHVSPSRTNLNLHNIFETPKMVKKGHNESWYGKGIWFRLYNSDGSKERWVWTFVHTISLFNKFRKESCFWYCWKVSLVVPVFETFGEVSKIKNYPGLQITTDDR